MKLIPLKGGHQAVVDDCDYEYLSGFNWHAKVWHGRVYAVRNNERGKSPRVLKMHQVIAGGSGVDHKNGNGLDNRRENLRLATHSQNGANRRVILNKYGYKGVFLHPYTQNKGRRWQRRKPWRALITVENKQIALGYFLTAEDAARAYDRAAVKYFGEFAATNADLLREVA